LLKLAGPEEPPQAGTSQCLRNRRPRDRAARHASVGAWLLVPPSLRCHGICSANLGRLCLIRSAVLRFWSCALHGRPQPFRKTIVQHVAGAKLRLLCLVGYLALRHRLGDQKSVLGEGQGIAPRCRRRRQRQDGAAQRVLRGTHSEAGGVRRLQGRRRLRAPCISLLGRPRPVVEGQGESGRGLR